MSDNKLASLCNLLATKEAARAALEKDRQGFIKASRAWWCWRSRRERHIRAAAAIALMLSRLYRDIEDLKFQREVLIKGKEEALANRAAKVIAADIERDIFQGMSSQVLAAAEKRRENEFVAKLAETKKCSCQKLHTGPCPDYRTHYVGDTCPGGHREPGVPETPCCISIEKHGVHNSDCPERAKAGFTAIAKKAVTTSFASESDVQPIPAKVEFEVVEEPGEFGPLLKAEVKTTTEKYPGKRGRRFSAAWRNSLLDAYRALPNPDLRLHYKALYRACDERGLFTCQKPLTPKE